MGRIIRYGRLLMYWLICLFRLLWSYTGICQEGASAIYFLSSPSSPLLFFLQKGLSEGVDTKFVDELFCGKSAGLTIKQNLWQNGWTYFFWCIHDKKHLTLLFLFLISLIKISKDPFSILICWKLVISESIWQKPNAWAVPIPKIGGLGLG
jgi:hypothetical protein